VCCRTFYAAADRREVTLFSLLDLTAPIECVDHDILLKRRQSFGIRENANTERLLASTGRQLTVVGDYNGQMSALMKLLFGVPQGSVLGPLLFLFDVIARSGLVVCLTWVRTPRSDTRATVWLTTSPHCHARACFNCVNFVLCGHL